MRLKKAMREKARLLVSDEMNRRKLKPFTGPTRILIELRRVRQLDDDNVVGALKHIRDGVALAALPLGDGPNTPYWWLPPVQIQVAAGHEGVYVCIEEMPCWVPADGMNR
ncbi:MAG TPA: hypothetical protein DCQ64_32580 [Candidatus Rokubacteria bacterium]|nr:hypothetical protein [Candidatus Rokubacteria bacterium]